MNYRILTLAETTVIPDEGPAYTVPRVRGSVAVDPQTPGLFTCRGKRIPRANTGGRGWTTEDYATLIHIKNNDYIVFSDNFDKIDPTNEGKAIKDYDGWPWKTEVVERVYGEAGEEENGIVTPGELISETVIDVPTIPTQINGSGMTAMIQKETLKAEAVPL